MAVCRKEISRPLGQEMNMWGDGWKPVGCQTHQEALASEAHTPGGLG